MKKHDEHHFATATDLKASVVERFNRSLKSRMWRFLTATNSQRYIDVLQDIMQGYNSSYHRSIKMRPVDVGKENEGVVFQNLYGGMKKNAHPVFKYKVGDVVRIAKVRGPFAKGYEQNYTEEFYIYIYIYAFSRHFYPKRLTLHSSYSFTFYQLCS